MSVSHVRDALEILINQMMRYYLLHGAKSIPDLKLYEMGTHELRDLLNRSLAGDIILSRMVAKECFRNQPKILTRFQKIFDKMSSNVPNKNY